MSISIARRAIAPPSFLRLGAPTALSSTRGGHCRVFSPSAVRFRTLSTEAAVDTTEPQWSLNSLRKEIARLEMKCLKYVANAHDQLDRLRNNQGAHLANASIGGNANVVVGPDPAVMEAAELRLEQASQRLASIRSVEERLHGLTNAQDPSFHALVPLLKELNILQSPPRSPPKSSSPNQPRKVAAPRLPYWIYKSVDGIEIRAGRSAQDNDILSCDRAHRDDKYWWMHASGCPGSHVVICYTGDDLASYPQTILDAAFVAAINSKNSGAGHVSVSLARCRDVRKPAGAKAGLVTLTGNVKNVKIDLRMEKARQERLQRIYP